MPKLYDLTTHDTNQPYAPRGFQQATLVLCPWQKVFLILLVIGLIVWGIFDWKQKSLSSMSFYPFYFTDAYRMLIIAGASKPREIQIEPSELEHPPNGKKY